MNKKRGMNILKTLLAVAILSAATGCNMVRPVDTKSVSKGVQIKVWTARSEDCKLGLMIGPAITF